MKYLKNALTVDKTFLGQTILAGEFFLIPQDEESLFANDDSVLIAIANGELIVAKNDQGTSNISEISEALSYLRNETPSEVNVINTPAAYPFARKHLEDGRSLFRRKHGVKGIVPAQSMGIIYIDVPYVLCKIDKIEITNGHPDDEADLTVLDTPQGHIQQSMGIPAGSITPSLMLNQFGFGVNLGDCFYEDKSDYDADLIANMRVQATYYNHGIEDKNIGINFVLHEIV